MFSIFFDARVCARIPDTDGVDDDMEQSRGVRKYLFSSDQFRTVEIRVAKYVVMVLVAAAAVVVNDE